MLRAVFVRTLLPGVTFEQFVEAWSPPVTPSIPATFTVSQNLQNDRQVLTIVSIDGDPEDLDQAAAELLHPEASARLATLASSLELSATFEDVIGPARIGPPNSDPAI